MIRFESSDWRTACVNAPERETPRTWPEVRKVYETRKRRKRKEIERQIETEDASFETERERKDGQTHFLSLQPSDLVVPRRSSQ